MFWKKSGNEEKVDIQWQTLNTLEQLGSIKKESHNQPVLIYKHSTRCGISSMVLNRLEREWSAELNGIKAYYLDLIAFRSVSNSVAELFNVYHESPQAIVIKDGSVVYHASHMNISVDALKQFN